MQGSNDDIKGLDSVKDSYKFYSKNVKKPLEYKMFMLVAKVFFEEYIKGLFEGKELRLFSDLGMFSIVKIKTNLKNLKPDWEATKKLWEKNEEAKSKKKLVYHLNTHSKGYYYKIQWRKGYIKNITSYSFFPVRAFSRGLASLIKNNKIEFAN